MSERAILLFENGLLSHSSFWMWIISRIPADCSVVVHERGSRSLFDSIFRRTDYPALLHRLRPALPPPSSQTPIVVIGHSIGALLARAHANALGDRVAGIVYVDPAPPVQFEPGVDQEFQYLRLRQNLLLRALRTALRLRMNNDLAVTTDGLPDSAKDEIAELLRDPLYWVDGYRESREAAASWRYAGQFPDIESRSTVVVSSDASATRNSMQNLFEEQILQASPNSRRLRAPGATHQSILTDKGQSAAVSEAIEWVVDRATGAA